LPIYSLPHFSIMGSTEIAFDKGEQITDDHEQQVMQLRAEANQAH